MKKETLKQFVFRKMASNGYVSDAELARFCRDNNWNKKRNMPFYQAEVYKKEYDALECQKNRFDNCENKTINSYKNNYKNAKTKYSLRHDGMEKNQFYKITKSYFLYLKEKGVNEGM